MDWQSHFLRQLDYQLWASQALFESLARLEREALRLPQGAHGPSIVRAVERLLLEFRLWSGVLQDADDEEASGDPRPLANADWRELKRQVQNALRLFRHWLEGRPRGWFDGAVPIARPEGGVAAIPVADLLAHVMNLLTHHRALIAAAATRLGAPAAEMDYLGFVDAMQQAARNARRAGSADARSAAPAQPVIYSLSFTAPEVTAITRSPVLLSLDGGAFKSMPPWEPWPGRRQRAGKGG